VVDDGRGDAPRPDCPNGDCAVGRFLHGYLDGYLHPAFAYMNWSVGEGPNPDWGVVVARYNAVAFEGDGGWAKCDVAPGGFGATVSGDRHGNPAVFSTDHESETELRVFWPP